MKERNKAERISILGIGIDDIRVDRAVALTCQYLEKNKFEYITFVNTDAALRGQEQTEFIELMDGAALVLPGDNNIEHAVGNSHWEEEGSSYQAQYFKRLFYRLNRQKAHVVFLSEQEEQLSITEQIVDKSYEKIRLRTFCWAEDINTDALINDINNIAPEALIICGKFDRIGGFLKENRQKINAGICICAAAMAAGENYVFPEWVQILHLEKAYVFFYKKPLHYRKGKLLKNRMKKIDNEKEETGKTASDGEEC